MPCLINLAYLLLILVASPWLLFQALRKGKYRDGWAAKFLGRVNLRGGDQPCVWVHAVSVGEVMLAQVLVSRLRARWPQLSFVVTSTSRTGYELARQRFADDLVSYAPLDFSWAVRTALRRWRPQLVVLVELELWPNLSWACRQADVPVAIVNGRLSAASARGYARVRPLIASVLRSCTLIAAANETYARRFCQLGARPETVRMTGSMKFDGAETDRQNPRTLQLAAVAGLTGRETVFVAGSTQAPEEQLALDTFRQLAPRFPQLRLILVPRHPERFAEVAQLLDSCGVVWQRRSHLSHAHPARAHVLLVDAMGELSAWWGLADIAFVGGSLDRRGGQNMIEPAAFGAAVSFGPRTHNFRDISQLLLDGQAARRVTANELSCFVACCLEAPAEARAMGKRATTLVQQHRGAADRTVELLSTVLDGDAPGESLRGPHWRAARAGPVHGKLSK